jgi:hypothetical protein
MRNLCFALMLICVPLLAQTEAPEENQIMASMGNVLQLFYYSDNLQMLIPIMDVDGKKPLPDSSLIEVALVTTPNQIDFWKDPHGTQLRNRWGGYYCREHYTNGIEAGMPEGFFYTDYFIWLDPFNSSVEPAAHCRHPDETTWDQIYVRLYNGKTVESSTHYKVSPIIDAPMVDSDPFEFEILQWSPWMPIPPKP